MNAAPAGARQPAGRGSSDASANADTGADPSRSPLHPSPPRPPSAFLPAGLLPCRRCARAAARPHASEKTAGAV